MTDRASPIRHESASDLGWFSAALVSANTAGAAPLAGGALGAEDSPPPESSRA